MDCKYKEKKDTTAIVAVFIAVLSLGASIYQGKKAQEHNELSVVPHLDIGFVFHDKKGFSSGITLDNAGLGTAVIKSVNIFWDESDTRTVLGEWSLLSDKIGINHTDAKPFVLIEGNALRPGRELMLYAVKWSTPSRIILQKDLNNKNIQVVVCYESLYKIPKQASLFEEKKFRCPA